MKKYENITVQIAGDDFDRLIAIPQAREILLNKAKIIYPENSVINCVPEMSAYKKESLTIDKMRQLFGQNYDGLLYYNFDNGQWNTNKYRGYAINKQKEHTHAALQFKDVLERSPEFVDYELIALVVMAIRGRLFPGVGQRKMCPVYNAFSNGDAALGTIVRRDKKNGQILPVPNEWLGVADSGEELVAQTVAGQFATQGLLDLEFRNQLLNIHGKHK